MKNAKSNKDLEDDVHSQVWKNPLSSTSPPPHGQSLQKKKKSEFHAKLYNMILHWEVGDKLLLSKVAQNICQQETLRDSNMVKIDIPSGVTQMEKTIWNIFCLTTKTFKRYWFYTFTINLHHPSLLSKHMRLDIEVFYLNDTSNYSFVIHLQQPGARTAFESIEILNSFLSIYRWFENSLICRGFN